MVVHNNIRVWLVVSTVGIGSVGSIGVGSLVVCSIGVCVSCV